MRYTIEDRVEQHGPSARARLLPHFERAGIPYPPARILLLGFKQERLLEIHAASATPGASRFIREYPILAASGTLGPKLCRGDHQVPEGFYGITYLNPNSKFHLSLYISYPNAFELLHAKRDGRTDPGGEIMIHGGDKSLGCLAIGDEAAEDLFVLAFDSGIANMRVVLSPVDFRARPLPSGLSVPDWMHPVYDRLRRELAGLPK